MILIGKDQLGWIQWTLANQITTTPTPKTKRPKRTRPSKKVQTTPNISTIATTITTVRPTKSSKKAKRKTTAAMTSSTAAASNLTPTTKPQKTAMSIIKEHGFSDELSLQENESDSYTASFEFQEKGCSRNKNVDHGS